MKRFFCTICKRIKRVHRIPANVHPLFAIDSHDRQIVIGYSHGTCTYHTSEQSRAQLNKRSHKPRTILTKKSAAPAAAPKKSKRGK